MSAAPDPSSRRTIFHRLLPSYREQACPLVWHPIVGIARIKVKLSDAFQNPVFGDPEEQDAAPDGITGVAD
ncbi:MAG TPA: hypothetical protein VHX61_05865 [Rhizomicrobium sp.]|jgi:hypothetical protein|nr:hypothetical protein [Rhizomicrobium sp.]